MLLAAARPSEGQEAGSNTIVSSSAWLRGVVAIMDALSVARHPTEGAAADAASVSQPKAKVLLMACCRCLRLHSLRQVLRLVLVRREQAGAGDHTVAATALSIASHAPLLPGSGDREFAAAVESTAVDAVARRCNRSLQSVRRAHGLCQSAHSLAGRPDGVTRAPAKSSSSSSGSVWGGAASSAASVDKKVETRAEAKAETALLESAATSAVDASVVFGLMRRHLRAPRDEAKVPENVALGAARVCCRVAARAAAERPGLALEALAVLA